MNAKSVVGGESWSRSVRSAIVAALLTLWGTTSSLVAAERIPCDRRLPPDVYAYASIPSVETLKDRWSQSLFGELARDPDLADFRDDLAKMLAEASREVEKHAGVRLDDLLKVPSGEVSVAVLRTAGARPLSFVGFLDFGESRETVDKLLEKFAEAIRDEEPKRTVHDFEDTKLYEYEFPPEEDDAKNGPNRKLAYFLKDTHFVVGSDREALETILVRWDGRHAKTFAENPVHRYIDERCGGADVPPVLTWYVDPVGLTEAFIAGRPADLQSAMILGALPQLGLRNLKAIGGSYVVAPRDFDSVTKTLFYVDEPIDGVLKVFRLPPARLAPPDWVPADVSSYFAFNWNVSGAYDAVETLVDAFQAPGTFRKLVDQIAQHEGGPMLHPRKDLVDQMTGVIHLLGMPVKEEDREDETKINPIVYAFGVKDAARMRGVLAAIAKTEGFPGKPREFRGETIYEMAGGEEIGLTIALGVAAGHLVVTTDVARLEDMLRGEKAQNPLVDLPEYRQAAAQFPAELSLLVFQRTDMELQAAYETLRKFPIDGELGGFDPKKLPKFDVLRKYLTAQGGYAIPDRHGAFLTSFSLRRSN